MAQQIAASVKKKKRKRKQVEEYCSYVIEILSWELRYSISENRNKKLYPGPYSEYSSIEMTGKVIEPPKIADREIQCTLYGSREHDVRLNHPEDYTEERYALVGSITAGKKYCSFTGWVPASVLFPIGQMVIAKEFRHLDLLGKPLFRNYANIHNIVLIKEPEVDSGLEAESI